MVASKLLPRALPALEPVGHWQTHSQRQVSPPPGNPVVVVHGSIAVVVVAGEGAAGGSAQIFQPDLVTDWSEDHVMSVVGVTPSGERDPWYASPLTLNMS